MDAENLTEHAMNDAVDPELESLLDTIYRRFQYDFRQYSAASVRRRLNHALRGLNCSSLSELRERIIAEPLRFTDLLQYLTVQVSDFFRDPEYFRLFREKIVPVLRTYPSLKLWIAGCSTGEEVYSFAILLREEGLLDKAILYATDINVEALRTAEEGIYALDRVQKFTTNHQATGAPCSLSNYYTAKYGFAAFDRSLRKNVVFSDHSLATDSVFSEVQLVSCRNVLIYFEPQLQERSIKLFRDALCYRGFLGLGSRETLQFSPEMVNFETFASTERWYRRK